MVASSRRDSISKLDWNAGGDKIRDQKSNNSARRKRGAYLGVGKVPGTSEPASCSCVVSVCGLERRIFVLGSIECPAFLGHLGALAGNSCSCSPVVPTTASACASPGLGKKGMP